MPVCKKRTRRSLVLSKKRAQYERSWSNIEELKNATKS